MPKTTPKPKTKTKQPNIWAKAFTWCKRHPVLTVVIIIVVGFFGYIAISSTVHQLQINKERKQFTQLQTDMTNFYDKLTKQVGQPYAHKVIPSCHYSSAKFEKGSLTCGVSIYMTYPAQDQASANALSAGLLSAARAINPTAKEYVSGYESENYIANIRLEFRTYRCSIGQWLIKEGSLPSGVYNFNADVRNGLFVDLACIAGAKAEYFPVVGS